ncbi:VanZ family protein [Bacillus sp. FJAT-42376]|uniref:VanZ family protein n=1 Tax=Bacillus sp. FJAT-42376 TaxID=2014076 RepID=UPI000F4EB0BC|nr:VanZ family protein [Bacillus sp. FJAT-42376]AZB43573.1 VanZ family protein [Bacillus sp. FJAT-42376]
MGTLVKVLAVLIPVLYVCGIWFQSSHSTNQILVFLASLSHHPAGSGEEIIFSRQMGTLLEILHLIEFGLLFFLMVHCMHLFGLSRQRAFPLALIAACSFSIIEEWHQLFVAGRSSSWIDLAKDWIGVFVVWAFMLNKERDRRRKKKYEWKTRLGRRV